MKKERKKLDPSIFANESMGKLMVKMCLPAVFTILIMVIYNMADIYFIGQLKNAYMVTGLSLCMPLTTVLSALGSMIGSGASSCISVAMGREDYSKIAKYSSFSFYFSILVGLVYGAIVLILRDPILTMLGTSANTRPYAETYLTLIMLGAPLTMLNTGVGQVMRCEGASVPAMIGNLFGTILNIILDPIFILGLGMGVSGAAIATLLGTLSSTIFYITYTLKKCKYTTIHLKDFTFLGGVASSVLFIGAPSGVSTLLNSISNIFENNLLANIGDNYVAALSVAGKATMVIGMLQIGVAMGVQPIIAYSYGAANHKRMKECVLKTAATTVAIGLVLTLLCRGFAGQLVKAFLDDPAIIPLGIFVIGISTLSGPFIGLYQLSSVFLQATEKPSYALFVSLLRQGLIFIPLLYLLNYLAGFTGIVWAQTAATFAACFMGMVFALYHYKKNILKGESNATI